MGELMFLVTGGYVGKFRARGVCRRVSACVGVCRRVHEVLCTHHACVRDATVHSMHTPRALPRT